MNEPKPGERYLTVECLGCSGRILIKAIPEGIKITAEEGVTFKIKCPLCGVEAIYPAYKTFLFTIPQ